mgnify:CR=1 FL=1
MSILLLQSWGVISTSISGSVPLFSILYPTSLNQNEYSGWVVIVPSFNSLRGQIPITPPQVLFPISFPNFKILAKAFNLNYYKIKNWADYNSFIKYKFRKKKSFLCEVLMDPEQTFYPKLSTFIDRENNIVSPPLEDLSPLISRKELKQNLLVKLHKKSQQIK